MIGKTRQPSTNADPAAQVATILRGVGEARGVLKAPSGPGRFRHERHAPTPPLDAFVEHFWMVRWDLCGLPPQQRETLPHPSAHLLIERGGSRLAGVTTGRFTRTLEGSGCVFGVKFKPAGFQPFLNASMATLTDRSCALSAVFGHTADTLEEAILAHDCVEDMIDVAAKFLSARLPSPDANMARVNAIVYAIQNDRSITRVEDLVPLHGVTLRNLQRLFNKYVGVSPKWVIQRYRLHEALEQLAENRIVDWPELALALGYYDQAHFIRDFKRMVGKSPAEYATPACPLDATIIGVRDRPCSLMQNQAHAPPLFRAQFVA
jgi:AraC-like DNA-binding protein